MHLKVGRSFGYISVFSFAITVKLACLNTRVILILNLIVVIAKYT